MIELGTAVVVGYTALALILWKLSYENGKLKELVKQKEAEIKSLRRALRDSD